MDIYVLELVKKAPELVSAPLQRYDSGDIYYELHVLSNDGALVRQIFETVWYPDVLDQWLTDNESEIRNGAFPWPISTTMSIAEAVAQFYDREDDPTDDEFCAIEKYCRSHGFRFGMRGCQIPNVFLGKTENYYEISYKEQDSFSRFRVSIERLFRTKFDNR